jgi:hypothetical protein
MVGFGARYSTLRRKPGGHRTPSATVSAINLINLMALSATCDHSVGGTDFLAVLAVLCCRLDPLSLGLDI